MATNIFSGHSSETNKMYGPFRVSYTHTHKSFSQKINSVTPSQTYTRYIPTQRPTADIYHWCNHIIIRRENCKLQREKDELFGNGLEIMAMGNIPHMLYFQPGHNSRHTWSSSRTYRHFFSPRRRPPSNGGIPFLHLKC